MGDELPGNLTGTHLVRAGRWAFQEAQRLFPKTRDRAELRRHALKLRFWPGCRPEDSEGQVLDLDWCWIRSLPGKRIGELRIHDTIDGCDNLRVIFYAPPIKTEPPMLWVLSVLQKKRDDFSTAQIQNFALRSKLILERFYHNPLNPEP
jgi:hypothetical protein